MRKLYLYATILACAAIISSCKEGVDILPSPPEISFLQCDDCVFTDTTLKAGSEINIGILALKGTAALDVAEIYFNDELISEITIANENSTELSAESINLLVPAEEGTYEVLVIVKDKTGREASTSLFITALVEAPPSVAFEACETCVGEGAPVYLGEKLILAVSAFPGSVELIKLKGVLGGDFQFDIPMTTNEKKEGLKNKQIEHLLEGITPGTYTLSLTATDINGLEATAAIEVQVKEPLTAPMVSIEECTDCKSGGTAIYRNVPFKIQVSGDKGDGKLTNISVRIDTKEIKNITLEGQEEDGFAMKELTGLIVGDDMPLGNSYLLEVALIDENGKEATDEIKTDVEIAVGPSVYFKTNCQKCVKGDGMVLYSDLNMFVKATATTGSEDLNSLTLYVGDHTFDIPLQDTERDGFGVKYIFQKLTGVQPGNYDVKLSVTDKNGLSDEVLIGNVIVKQPVIIEYKNRVLGYNNLHPRFFSTANGKHYYDTDQVFVPNAKDHAEVIDLAFYAYKPGDVNLWVGMLSFPQYSQMDAYFDMEGWSVERTTYLKVVDYIDYDNITMQELADIDIKQSLAIDVSSVSPDEVILFETEDAPGEKRRGVIRINSFKKNGNPNINFDIKIFDTVKQ